MRVSRAPTVPPATKAINWLASCQETIRARLFKGAASSRKAGGAGISPPSEKPCSIRASTAKTGLALIVAFADLFRHRIWPDRRSHRRRNHHRRDCGRHSAQHHLQHRCDQCEITAPHYVRANAAQPVKGLTLLQKLECQPSVGNPTGDKRNVSAPPPARHPALSVEVGLGSWGLAATAQSASLFPDCGEGLMVEKFGMDARYAHCHPRERQVFYGRLFLCDRRWLVWWSWPLWMVLDNRLCWHSVVVIPVQLLPHAVVPRRLWTAALTDMTRRELDRRGVGGQTTALRLQAQFDAELSKRSAKKPS